MKRLARESTLPFATEAVVLLSKEEVLPSNKVT
jgi:hypothetical protein